MRRPLSRRLSALITLLLTVAALTGTKALAAPNNRLDRDVLPVSQSIRLKIDPSRPDYSGAVRIELKVVAPSETFRLYARDMDVISVRLSSAAGPVTVSHEAGAAGQLIVRMGTPLAPGDYGLDIDFRNDLGTRADALYRVKSGEDWYCFTQFEPVAAREAFPCWDEPEFKIPFQVTLTVPEKCSAVSNTPIEKESTIGGQRTVVFKRTPPLPTYLVAIAAGPFDYLPIRGMSVPGRVVTVKGSSGLAREAARMTPPLLAACEKYFGRPYPYAKLDLLAVPEFAAGAMENPGAITYREEILLIDPATAGVRQRQRLASITAHELAHMWFGNLVTMAWWDDLWLNESFASWMGDKVTHQVFPQYHTPVRELSGTQSAMNTDARLSTRAIRKSVDAFANLSRLFDELSYDKGQAVLGMIEAWLGPEVLRRGVVAYLKEHEWKNATAADLWRALSDAAGRDITPVTQSFLEQGGVPLVSAEVLAGGRVRLQQRRFLNEGVAALAPTVWKIPVVLRYSDGRQVHTQSVLLAESEQIVTLEKTTTPAWVHPNAGERGYYRWLLPPAALLDLVGNAARVMDTRERVGCLNNLSALLDAGSLSGGDYLSALERFTDDAAPEVVSALISGLDRVYTVFVSPDLRSSFAIAVRRMLRPSLARFGIDRGRREAESVSLMRPSLFAALGVYAYEREILDWARLAAPRYLAHPDSVDPSVAGAALNLAARDGDLSLFEAYRLRLESTKIPSERARFLSALGHFRSGPMVERALDYALTGPLRPQEILTIPNTMTETDELNERRWRWFRAGLKPITSRIPPSYLARLPSLAMCCDTLRIAEAEYFFSTPEANHPGTREELAKVVERIRECVGLRQRQSPAIARYLLQSPRSRPAPAGTPGH